MFPNVDDLSSYLVNERVKELIVMKEEVIRSELQKYAVQAQYSLENLATRRLIHKQLNEYIQRVY